MASDLDDLKFKVRILVTPIILSLSPGRSLADLLDPTIESKFDLDGTGRPQKYPWLKPDTAILVWDSKHTGAITSGRQLFGTVTWWMFWDNRYSALSALDDNGDGWLTGRELEGLALWFDRNQNGVSDPGEVVPIAQTEITAIHVRADSRREGQSWKSSQGIKLRGGSVLPTWDWVVAPMDAPTEPAPRLTTRRQPGTSFPPYTNASDRSDTR